MHTMSFIRLFVYVTHEGCRRWDRKLSEWVSEASRARRRF